jgi:hypothetical protein
VQAQVLVQACEGVYVLQVGGDDAAARAGRVPVGPKELANNKCDTADQEARLHHLLFFSSV